MEKTAIKTLKETANENYLAKQGAKIDLSQWDPDDK